MRMPRFQASRRSSRAALYASHCTPSRCSKARAWRAVGWSRYWKDRNAGIVRTSVREGTDRKWPVLDLPEKSRESVGEAAAAPCRPMSFQPLSGPAVAGGLSIAQSVSGGPACGRSQPGPTGEKFLQAGQEGLRGSLAESGVLEQCGVRGVAEVAGLDEYLGDSRQVQAAEVAALVEGGATDIRGIGH